MGAFWRLIVWLCRGATLIACLGLGASVVIVCTDVLLRTLGHPFQGAYDLLRITSALTIACALPLTTAVKGHVAIEYFFRKLNRTGRLVVDSIMRLVMIGGFLVAGWAFMLQGNGFRQNRQVTDTIEIPIFWVSWVMAAACVLTAVVVGFHLLHPRKELIRA